MASPIPQETIVTLASNGGMVLLAPLVLAIFFVIAWLGYCCGYRKKKVHIFISILSSENVVKYKYILFLDFDYSIKMVSALNF